jgi:hypothetical protein
VRGQGGDSQKKARVLPYAPCLPSNIVPFRGLLRQNSDQTSKNMPPPTARSLRSTNDGPKRLQAISKMWIRVQGKVRVGEKAEHTRQYVSILSGHATPPWGLRRLFEMACNLGNRLSYSWPSLHLCETTSFPSVFCPQKKSVAFSRSSGILCDECGEEFES